MLLHHESRYMQIFMHIIMAVTCIYTVHACNVPWGSYWGRVPAVQVGECRFESHTGEFLKLANFFECYHKTLPCFAWLLHRPSIITIMRLSFFFFLGETYSETV